MERARPRGRRYSESDRDLAQSMLARGDRIEDVAAYFGANQGRFKKDPVFPAFEDLSDELRKKLPPPGPYKVDPQYIRLYQLIVEINALWDKGSLPEAKGLLEDVVKYGVHADELRDDMAGVLDGLFRDDRGLSTI